MTVAAFQAHFGTELHSYTFEIQDDRPVKLGDGSFGAVFKVIGPDGIGYAAKLFYETPDEALRYRYRQEMGAKKLVLDGLKKIKLPELLGNLVLAEAWTDGFLESEAFRALEPYFKETSLRLCGWAAVMPLFRCTLKELLEHGAPRARLVKGALVDAPGCRGYDLLAKMAFSQRESVLLPIARRVAFGLRALHAAGLYHQDLKPANILVRGAADGVDFSLSDFGFVRPNEYPQSNFKHVGSAVPVGTRHYRSTEQRDYFDVCEVDVTVDKGKIRLTTLDRKFQDSIVEKGDTVTFFKNPDVVFQIDDISHDGKTGMSIVEVKTDQASLPSSDSRTQAIFYKSQTLRTDLFGLGGIMFDLLTGGRSPERFSEFLRSWDHKNRTIADLMNRYRAYKESSSGGPEIIALFDQLRLPNNEFSYPSSDIVEIILSCVLSNPEDSYYKRSAGKQAQEQLSKVCDDIEQASLRRGAAALVGNPLWENSPDDRPAGGSEPASFSRDLDEIKRESYLPKRYVLAYRKLMVLVTAVKDALSKTLSKEVFFFDLSPDNLRRISGTQVWGGPTYTTLEQYQRALLVGDMDGSQDAASDTFTPPAMRFMARSAHAIAASDNQNADSKVSFIFSDSRPLWQPLRPGDYVRYSDQEQTPLLYSIKSIDRTGEAVEPIQIGPPLDPSTQPSRPLPAGKVLLIRAVRPVEYYLSMLGIYIHHLFFATPTGRSGDTGTLPSVVWMIEQARSSGFFHSRIIGEGRDCLTNDDLSASVSVKRGDVAALQERIAKIYLWLVCRDFVQNGDWTPTLPIAAGNSASGTLSNYLEILRDSLGTLIRAQGRELDAPAEEGLLGHVPPNLQITGQAELDAVLRRLVSDRLTFGRRAIF
jgi:serine/threonine protein kinase